MKKRYITAICFFIAFLFGVSAYTLFDKDSVFSARENRELSKMPYFTLENYADASFMKNFEAYYNDTFPIRDNLIDATRRIDSAFYLNFLIGDDDVLVIPTSQGAVADENGEKPENVGGCMIYNNHIMEIFKKSEENTEKYADIVNKLTKESGLDEVYVMVPPPSYALYAPGDCANDYLEATDLLKSKLETAKFIDLYDTFREHSDENIIFRTDHHWTERGAYYAANEFLKEAEYESLPPLDEYESGTKKGFLGSLYKLIMSNKESMIFEKKPDSVEYFYPMHKTKVYNYQNSLMTSPEERQIIKPDYDKDTNYYCVYMGGDYRLGYIESDVKNGKSIMIVRDSYGHALIPLLADEYQYIYFIEPRYFTGEGKGFPLADFIQDKKIEKLLFVDYANMSLGKYWMSISDNMQWLSREKQAAVTIDSQAITTVTTASKNV